MMTARLNTLRQWLGHLTTGDGLKARLIRGGLGSAGIQALNRVLALALGIVLARMLGADGYGVYAYAFAIMSLLMVAAEAGVPTLLMREVAASQALAEWGVLRGVLRRAGQFVIVTAGLVAVIGLLVLWAVGDRLSQTMFTTVALMLLVLPLAAGTKTVMQALKGLHRVVLGQAVNMLMRPFLVLVMVGAGSILWPDLRQPQYAMAAQLLAAGAVLAAGVVILRRLTPGEARTAAPVYRSRDWLRSAIPFTLIGGALVVNSQTDIVMLGWFVEANEVGIYRVASQVATLVIFSLQVVTAVMTPQFSRLYAQGEIERIQKSVIYGVRAILLIALPMSLSFIFAGGVLVSWVFGPDFASAHASLAILAGGQLIVAILGLTGPLLSMAGHETIVSRTIWVSALLNIALNATLIPIFGLLGAALSTALSQTLWQGYLFYVAKAELDIICLPFACGWIWSRE